MPFANHGHCFYLKIIATVLTILTVCFTTTGVPRQQTAIASACAWWMSVTVLWPASTCLHGRLMPLRSLMGLGLTFLQADFFKI